jgi:hypothetical protein
VKPQPHGKSKGFVKLVLSVALFAFAAVLFLNRQYIVDSIAYMQYRPNGEMAAIAERASLNDHGKFYLYASQAEVQNRDAFNASCHTARTEESVVLGCYTGRRIYVFDVTDTKLDGIKEVTAAHEMLHAAYDRLSDTERKRVNGLLDAAAARITDQSIKDILKVYEKTEPGERLNELHSILGTEAPDLGTELEAYYKQYFKDRQTVVALSQKYEGVFNDLRSKQDELARELEQMAVELTESSKSFNESVTQLNADISTFNNQAASGGFNSQAEFNAERASLVSRQESLRDRQEQLNARIAVYNEKRKELESINSQAETLNRSINSNLPAVPSL